MLEAEHLRLIIVGNLVVLYDRHCVVMWYENAMSQYSSLMVILFDLCCMLEVEAEKCFLII